MTTTIAISCGDGSVRSGGDRYSGDSDTPGVAGDPDASGVDHDTPAATGLSGWVRHQNGVPAVGRTVRVRDSGAVDLVTVTDSQGAFVVLGVTPPYDIHVRYGDDKHAVFLGLTRLEARFDVEEDGVLCSNDVAFTPRAPDGSVFSTTDELGEAPRGGSGTPHLCGQQEATVHALEVATIYNYRNLTVAADYYGHAKQRVALAGVPGVELAPVETTTTQLRMSDVAGKSVERAFILWSPTRHSAVPLTAGSILFLDGEPDQPIPLSVPTVDRFALAVLGIDDEHGSRLKVVPLTAAQTELTVQLDLGVRLVGPASDAVVRASDLVMTSASVRPGVLGFALETLATSVTIWSSETTVDAERLARVGLDVAATNMSVQARARHDIATIDELVDPQMDVAARRGADLTMSTWHLIELTP